MRTGGSRAGRILGGFAIAGPILFTAACGAATLVQTHYSMRREDISALAAGSAHAPWLMILGFVALALGTAGLGAGLFTGLPGSIRERSGAVLLAVAGAGILVAGLARNDCSSLTDACKSLEDAGDVSWHHNVHNQVSVLVFLCLVLAPALLAGRFRATPGWASLRMPSLAATPVLLLLMVLFGSEAIDGWNGITQRVLLGVFFLWMIVVGRRLYGASG